MEILLSELGNHVKGKIFGDIGIFKEGFEGRFNGKNQVGVLGGKQIGLK